MTKQISFEDIRKGDRIRAVRVEGGITITREGVAHENAYGGWFTREGGLLIASANIDATITLVDRPVPAEPEGVGVVVETEDRIRFVSIHPNPGGRRWVRLWWTGRGTSDHATVWAWDALVRAYGSLSVVREGV